MDGALDGGGTNNRVPHRKFHLLGHLQLFAFTPIRDRAQKMPTRRRAISGKRRVEFAYPRAGLFERDSRTSRPCDPIRRCARQHSCTRHRGRFPRHAGSPRWRLPRCRRLNWKRPFAGLLRLRRLHLLRRAVKQRLRALLLHAAGGGVKAWARSASSARAKDGAIDSAAASRRSRARFACTCACACSCRRPT